MADTTAERGALMDFFIDNLEKKKTPKKGDGVMKRPPETVSLEAGSTNVHLTRRPIPPHLENVGKNPETVVLGEKRTVTDLQVINRLPS